MKTEIEAKWLNINHTEFRALLIEQGASCVHPERLMLRKNFDFPDGRLNDVNGWIRVRAEGDKVTLSYKQLHDRGLHGTKEITVVVDDFDATCQLLISIGLRQQSYQETKRESWLLDGVEIELDTWPWIQPFVELEAPTELALKNVAAKLSLSMSEALHGSVETAYQAEYTVSEEEIDSWPEITFIPTPVWLEAKRINKEHKQI